VTQRTRILLAVAILAVIALAVLGIEQWQRSRQTISEADLLPGSIPIYLNGKLVAGFQPTDLEQLGKVSFVDAEDSKTQEGWLLRDVILVHVPRTRLKGDAVITVSSSSRNKSAQVTWAEVDEPANMVMFDLSGRGTLKLVSQRLEQLDVRDEWVQDVDKIEVQAQ
jgi:hypothetical protein